MSGDRKTISRRRFVSGASAAAGAGLWLVGSAGCTRVRPAVRPRRISPSEKLNVAFVGVGGRGGSNLKETSDEDGVNVVALCDVDKERLDQAGKKFPDAKQYQDYRKLLDEMDKQIDAVVVSTPDHTHAVALMAAIKRGKHVYSEKPLAHSIQEIRELRKAAREHKVVTQLGNQGHSFPTIRTFCEWVWDGAIGNVHTIHAACGATNTGLAQLARVKEEQPPVPETLDWDVWLGPAQLRPYHSAYLPGRWRGWTPFGNGTIGDWVCHVVDPVFWALDLGAPTTIECHAEGYDPAKYANDVFPRGMKVRFEFPARGKRGPITLHWYDGFEKIPRPEGLDPNREVPGTGAVVLGDKGGITYGSHGASGVRLFPDEKMKAYKQPEQKIPRVKNHHADWLRAIRSGQKAGSDFDYGGPLTEIALLGIIAMRMMDKKLEWDSEKMRFTNSAEANAFLNPPYRKGWTL